MEPPQEPVIPRNECYAALQLIDQLCENIMESGDVEENVVELVRRFQKSLQDLEEKVPEEKDSEQKVPEDKEDMAVSAILATGLLPTCHNRWSSREQAGAALLCLIEANLVVYSELNESRC